VELSESELESLLATLPIGDDLRSDWDQRADRIGEIAAPDLVTTMIAEEGGLRNEFHGHDGYREAWADWLQAFDSYRVELEGSAAGVLRFAEGRLQRIEFHLDREAALRAAGLDPQNVQE
jgi:hypothetical protein